MFIIWKRYPGAPLATFVSILSSILYSLALFMVVGYALNWDGMQESMQLQEALLVALISEVVGFVLMKLAAWLAQRKREKQAEAWGGCSVRSAPTPGGASAPAGTAAPGGGTSGAGLTFCPKCGSTVRREDVFCSKCGESLGRRSAPAAAPSTVPAAQDKPKSKFAGLLLTLLVIGLAYGGGRFLGGQMARSYRGSEPAATTYTVPAIDYVDPSAVKKVTLTPEVSTGSQKVTLTPEPSTGSLQSQLTTAPETGWTLQGATDAEISAVLENYFCGASGNTYGMLFMDADGVHGGLIYAHTDAETDDVTYIGTWQIPEDQEEPLILVDGDGVRHTISISMQGSDKLTLYSLDTGSAYTWAGLTMERTDELKAEVYQYLLQLRDGE